MFYLLSAIINLISDFSLFALPFASAYKKFNSICFFLFSFYCLFHILYKLKFLFLFCILFDSVAKAVKLC